MSKYDAIWKYIGEQGQETLKLSFSQIGEIAGVPIDHSFLRFKKGLTQYGYFLPEGTNRHFQEDLRRLIGLTVIG